MLQEAIDLHTDSWGGKVTQVAVESVDLSQEMVSAMAKQAESLHLRYLWTLTEIAAEKNSTIIFPIPIDISKALMGGKHGEN